MSHPTQQETPMTEKKQYIYTFNASNTSILNNGLLMSQFKEKIDNLIKLGHRIISITAVKISGDYAEVLVLTEKV